MSGRPITFSELRFPPTPDDLGARGQTFYSGPSWLHQAVGNALHAAPQTAEVLHSIEDRGGDWGVVVASTGDLAFEALIRSRQARREVVVRTQAPVDGLTQLIYGVGDDDVMQLRSLGNRAASPTHRMEDEEPFGPVSTEDRARSAILGLPDFRTVVALEFEPGMLHDDLDMPDRLRELILYDNHPLCRQAVDAVIGLNGIARFIEETPSNSLIVHVMGDEPHL